MEKLHCALNGISFFFVFVHTHIIVWFSLIYIPKPCTCIHILPMLPNATAFTVIFYKYEKNNKWDKVFEQNTMAI